MAPDAAVWIHTSLVGSDDDARFRPPACRRRARAFLSSRTSSIVAGVEREINPQRKGGWLLSWGCDKRLQGRTGRLVRARLLMWKWNTPRLGLTEKEGRNEMAWGGHSWAAAAGNHYLQFFFLGIFFLAFFFLGITAVIIAHKNLRHAGGTHYIFYFHGSFNTNVYVFYKN